MDLNLDREQEELVSTARHFLAQKYPLTESGGEMAHRHDPRDLLGSAADLGWTALTIPSEHGGIDATLVELSLVAEELGRAGLSSSVVASQTLVARPLVRAGQGGRFPELLTGIAQGTHVATMPLLSAGATDEWSTPLARGVRGGDGWTLDAELTLVPFGQEADVFLVQADLEGRGRSLVVVPADRAQIRPQVVIGGDPRAAVTFAGVAVSPDDVVDVAPEQVGALVDDALLAATVVLSAHAVGACEKALELSVVWAKDREQFGRPIGSFQTVSNRLADIRVWTDASRLMVWEAAWSVEEGTEDAALLVSVAKAYLTQVSDDIVFNAHQVHGAMGFSAEYPLHVFTRIIKAFRVAMGSGSSHLQRVATGLGI
jgi:alkylation response protein AidB-like acyl-CoA dehydrogenase